MLRAMIVAALGALALPGCETQVSGAWSITAVCPAESKLGERTVTATATMTEVGPDRYRGTILNSFGQKGRLDASFNAKVMAAAVAWEGSGTTEALLTFNSTSRTFTGTDSEGCALSVRRPG